MFLLALGCGLGWELLSMEEPFLVLDQDSPSWQWECHPLRLPHGNSVSLHQIPVKGEKRDKHQWPMNALSLLSFCSVMSLPFQREMLLLPVLKRRQKKA